MTCVLSVKRIPKELADSWVACVEVDGNRLRNTDCSPLTILADGRSDGIENTSYSGCGTNHDEASSDNMRSVCSHCFGCVGVEILGRHSPSGFVLRFMNLFLPLPSLPLFPSGLSLGPKKELRPFKDSLLLSKALFVLFFNDIVC